MSRKEGIAPFTMSIAPVFFLGLIMTLSCASAAVLPRCVSHPQGEKRITAVIGFPGERLYISPKHPRECSEEGVNACPGGAYLLPGDKVESLGTCDDWAFVRFASGQHSTVGWVAARRINMSDTPSINLGLVEHLDDAVDPRVCEATLKGAVEDVGLRGVTRYPLLPKAGGLDYVPSGFPEVIAEGNVDLFNDGKPRPVALVSLDYFFREFEYYTEWPVILNSDGLPDATVSLRGKLFEAAGQHNHVRLFRLHGVIYVEYQPTSDLEDSSHEVWRFSTEGAVKVCSYTRGLPFVQAP
jgi:hypothetical protein